MNAEELKARTRKFALRILKLCDVLPRTTSGRAIAHQLVRSGTSIGANYRAACRARSRAEFVAKLGIVVEEADETQYWLDLLSDSAIVRNDRLCGLRQEVTELLAIFSASQFTAKQRIKAKSSISRP